MSNDHDEVSCGMASEVWNRLRRVFEESEAVYLSEIGPMFSTHVPREYSLLVEFVGKFKESRGLMIAGLADKSPKVVGFCMVGLRLLERGKLRSHLKPVHERREMVTFHGGCLHGEERLQELADRILRDMED